ncbi:MAG: TauD/TfdA dioxygenase family protein [Rhodospirillales bacterium]
MAMQITPLGEHTGAEVTGIDLNKGVTEAEKKELNKALADYACLVVRGQNYTPDDYMTATAVFGEHYKQNFTDLNLDGYDFINVVSSNHKDPDGKPNTRGSRWHTDHTNHECPPKCTILYAVSLPEQGGNTGVCNMRAAYDGLPDEFKERIDGLKTVNVHYGRAAARSSILGEKIQKQGNSVPHIHPLVRTHPESGKKAIYYHDVKTDYIVDMTPEETRELLQEISDTAIKPDYIYKHAWKMGDMLVIDDRQALHQAYHDYDRSQHRQFYRILTAGDKPF